MGWVNTFLKILTILLTPIVTFVLLLVGVFIFIPSLILQPIIVKCAHIFKPQLGKVLSPLGRIFAIQKCYSKTETPLSIVCIFHLKGRLEVEQLRNEFQKKLLNARNSDGELLYPELQQNLVPWMGYLFWKSVSNFKLEDHIYVAKDVPVDSNGKCTHDQLILYWSDLLQRSWYEDKAMWEFIVIHNFIPKDTLSDTECERTVLIFRLHHALADGLSGIQLLTQLSKKNSTMDKVAKYRPPKMKSGLKSKIFKTISTIVKMPYELTEFLTIGNDFNEWKFWSYELAKSKLRIIKMNKVSMSYLKQIRDLHGVGFNSLVLAIVAGFIREMSIKLRRKIPHSITIVLPVQLPGRSENKLENLSSLVYIFVPTGEPDPIKRLHLIHKQFKKTQASTIPLSVAIFSRLSGMLPNFLLTQTSINNKLGPSLILANVPTTAGPMDTCGYLVEDICGSVSHISATAIGMFLSFVTYNGYARLIMITSDLLIPMEIHEQEIIDLVSQQIEYYHTLGKMNIKKMS